MYTKPFNSFLTKNNIELKFPSTACWRGYYGPGRFATENYFSQTSRLILIIITSLGLNIFSHEKSAFWLIGSQEHSILKHEKSPTPFR